MMSELTQLDESTLEYLRGVVKSDLFLFCKGILGFRDMSPIFHGPLCDLLMDDDIPDKLCVLPRGTFKTSICTIGFPLWQAVRNSNVTILIVQNTHTNALGKLGKIRSIVETNQLFRLLFPEVLPTRESTWKNDSLCFNRSEPSAESTFEGAGIGTAVTGRHYDIIVEDDTVSPDISDLGEENVIQPSRDDIVRGIAYHNVLYPILKVTGKPQNIVVGTRWFQKDLISHIQENDKGFHVYERAILERDGRPDFDGSPSFPEVFTQAKIDRLEQKLGRYMFSCNPAGAPVMQADWSSKPIEEIKIGDRVIGFEFPEESGGQIRTVPTTVLAINSRIAKVVKITMASGRIIRCTPDHKWLADMNRRRERPQHLYRPAEVGRPLHYLCNPFIPESNTEANCGWLAGMFDGEGGVSGKLRSGAGSHLVIAQSLKVNPDIHAEVGRQLDLLGLPYNKHDTGYAFGTSREDRRRFLQWCYPFVKWHRVYESLWGARCFEQDDVVIKIEPDGEEMVYSFQTGTGNYVCWGYASKNCLCMNKPLRSEDMVFQPHWIREYDTNPTNLLIYTTVDPAGDPEDSQGAPDYNVVMTCGKDISSGNIFVLDYFRERCHPGRTIQAMFDHARMYFPLRVGVETVAYQKTILYYARQKMIDEKTYFQMEPITNLRRSKNARIMGLQPIAQRGQLHVRPWMRELVSELMAFPLGANDDIIDALSMQLELMAVGSVNSDNFDERARNDPLTLDHALASIDARRESGDNILSDAMSFDTWN